MNRIILIGIVIASVVAIVAAGMASGEPDGLERVAEDKGFMETALEPGYELLPDYTIPGIEQEWLSTALAGIVGVVVVAALTAGIGWLLRTRKSSGTDGGAPSTEPRSGV